jgi:predicted MFS family arabinose efflux permease
MNGLSALRLAIGGMLALALAIGIGRFAFTPILPMMQKDYGLTLRMAGLLASVNYIGYFAGALSAIWIRAKVATVVRASLVAVAILTCGMGVIHDPVAWLLLRGLAGILSAWILVFASAYVLQKLAMLDSKRLGGVVFGGVGLGIALTGALCLLFLHLSWSADEAWVALGAAALLLALVCWPGYRDADRATTAKASAQMPSSSLRRHMPAIICYGIFGFGYIIPATFLPAMAKHVVADPAVFGWAWPIFGSAALISTLMAGWLSAHLRNRLIWALSHGVMAVGVAMPVLMPGIAGIAISACCVGGTFMVATMTGMQEARLLAPEHASQLMAAMTAAFGMGQICGPLLVSAVAERHNGMNALLIVAALMLLASAVVLAVGTTRHLRTEK